jgi:hypothetical protein
MLPRDRQGVHCRNLAAGKFTGYMLERFEN